MAKLPIIKRLAREDFPEAPDWIDKLLYPLNQALEGTYNALNGALTVGDNIQGEIRTLTFTTLSGYDGTAANWTDIEWTHGLKAKPQGLVLLRLWRPDVADYAPIEGDVYLDWIEQNGVVTIGLVRGLTASTKYSLRVLLI